MVIVATGETVHPALEAAALMQESLDVEVMVVSMHTVKPLDTELLTKVAATGMPILTVEEHSVNGGMGEACGSFLLQQGFHNRFRVIGIPDEYTVTGSQQEIFDHYGINGQGIAEIAQHLLGVSQEKE